MRRAGLALLLGIAGASQACVIPRTQPSGEVPSGMAGPVTLPQEAARRDAEHDEIRARSACKDEAERLGYAEVEIQQVSREGYPGRIFVSLGARREEQEVSLSCTYDPRTSNVDIIG